MQIDVKRTDLWVSPLAFTQNLCYNKRNYIQKAGEIMNSENDFENNDKHSGKKPLATELYFVIIIAAFVVIFAAAWLLDTEDDKAEIYYKAPDVTEAAAEIFDSKPVTTKVSIEVTQFPIDINLATVDQLCEINGIGEVIAQKIIDYRTEVGIIHDLKELEQISGIGESTIKLLAENVFVSNSDYIPFTTTIVTTTKITTTAVKNTTTREITTTAPPESEVPEPEFEDDSPREVHINYANADEIADSLKISHELAEQIVSVREQIGGYSTLEELYLVDSMTQNIMLQIMDYIVID